MDSGTLGFVIHLSRLVGGAPYMRTAKDGVSKTIFVFGAIVVTFVSLYVVFSLMHKIVSTSDLQNRKLIMLNIIHMFGIFVLAAIVMIGAWTSKKRITHMAHSLRKLDEIHEIFRSNGLDTLGDRKPHYFIWLYLFGSFIMRFVKKLRDIILTISIAVLCVWVDLYFLQVILLSEKVLGTLTAINKSLHELSIRQNKKGESKLINNKMIKPKIAFVHSKNDTENLEDLHKHTTLQRHRTQTASEESIDYAIRRLSHCYMIICQIVRDITDVNGLLLIMILLYHMLYLEFITYQIIIWVSGENNLSFEIIFLMYHDLSHAFGLFLLVDCFHRTHSEMEHTQLLIRCLKYENDPPATTINELHLFQRILVLQSTKYSPLNICTLDRSLLLKVLGILISYLVIIITYGPKIDKEAKKEM